MANRLSHTAVSMYDECAKKYWLHYVDKLRPKTTGGALIFGASLDVAITHLLQGKPGADAVFKQAFSTFEINGKTEEVCGSVLVDWSPNDYHAAYYGEDENAIFETLKAEIKSGEFKHRAKYSRIIWHSLFKKGLAMLELYRTDIMPHIKEVLATQHPVVVTNTDGDQIIGFVDFICKWEDDSVILFDNKTASCRRITTIGLILLGIKRGI
jgi:hypothetical protein